MFLMTFSLQLIDTTGRIVSLTHLFCNYITSFKKDNAQFQFLSSLSAYKTNSNMEFSTGFSVGPQWTSLILSLALTFKFIYSLIILVSLPWLKLLYQ